METNEGASESFVHRRRGSKLQTRTRFYLTPNTVFDKTYKAKRDDRRLRSAASVNDVDKLNQLLVSGVNPNNSDENGRTPLHLACCRGYSDIVRLLLLYNADCNVVDKLGNTPLHLAVCTTSTATVNLLLNAGSCVTSKGNNGCTPLQLAQSKLSLLQKHNSEDYMKLKMQISDVVGIMKKLKKGKNEALLIEGFSRLNVLQSASEMSNDFLSLLKHLDNIHINQLPSTHPNEKRITESTD